MSSLLLALTVVLLFSACFSGSETGMMALNRYQLNVWVASGSRRAAMIKRLLDRPDRLLGVILIGNTLANNLAVALLSMMVDQHQGPLAMMMATIALTLVMLVLVEVMPKTFAALQPKKVAMCMVWPLNILLGVMYPLVWVVNALANGLLRFVGVRADQVAQDEPLGPEGLKGLLRFGNAQLSKRHRHMLFGVLDLESIKIEEVMVQRNAIVALDVQKPWLDLLAQVKDSPRMTWLVIDGSVDQVLGVITVQDVLCLLEQAQYISVDVIRQYLQPVAYAPEGISLSRQLAAFQKEKSTVALVVDEYGEVLGMIGLHDIVEEIIGHYAQSSQSPVKLQPQSDGSYLVRGDVSVRDLNRHLDWQLPVGGPNSTLGGLIVEQLEGLPAGPICLLLSGHPVEVADIKNRRISRVKIWPKLPSVLESVH